MAEDDTLNSDPRRISRCVEADDRQSSSWSFSRVNTLESENRILIYNISSFCLLVVSGWTSALKVVENAKNLFCLFERASIAGDGVGKFPFYLSGKWLGLHPWTRFASGNTLQCRLRWFLFVAMKKILTQFSVSDNYSITHSQAVCTVCTGHCQEERKQENDGCNPTAPTVIYNCCFAVTQSKVGILTPPSLWASRMFWFVSNGSVLSRRPTR